MDSDNILPSVYRLRGLGICLGIVYGSHVCGLYIFWCLLDRGGVTGKLKLSPMTGNLITLQFARR